MAENKMINIYFIAKKQIDMNINKSCNNFDRTKALEESRIILNQIDHYDTEMLKIYNNSREKYIHNGNLLISSCCFCKVLITKRKKNECGMCNRLFCNRHLIEISHNCNKGRRS